MNRRNTGAEDDAEAEAGEAGQTAGSAGLRIDRWLWCARLYKTRSLAAQAVTAGRVRVGEHRVKPSRLLKRGEVLNLAQGGRDFELHVLALPARRGPATEARACYAESAASAARGLVWHAQQRLAALSVPRPQGRPDKKARRELLALARRQGRA